jgi:hypothetical protein
MMEVVAPRPKRKARPKEVNMKMMAMAAVILCRKVVAPRLPKTAWLEPPKAAPISEPLPLWSRTMSMRATHTEICTRMIISFIYFSSVLTSRMGKIL